MIVEFVKDLAVFKERALNTGHGVRVGAVNASESQNSHILKYSSIIATVPLSENHLLVHHFKSLRELAPKIDKQIKEAEKKIRGDEEESVKELKAKFESGDFGVAEGVYNPGKVNEEIYSRL